MKVSENFYFFGEFPSFLAGDAQRDHDRHFIQNLISNNTQVVEEGHDDRKIEVIAILNRVLDRGRRRGGPTKDMLMQLCQFCPVVTPHLPKSEIVAILLGDLMDHRHVPPPPVPPVVPPVAPPVIPPVVVTPVMDVPVGPPPAGWGHLGR